MRHPGETVYLMRHRGMMQRDKQDSIELCWYFSYWLCLHTCHEVSKSYGGQGDDHKIKGLQRRPTLDVFKDGRRERHKQQAAKQHKQQCGDDTDLSLTDVPVLQRRQREKQRKLMIWTENFNAVLCACKRF